MIGRYTCYNDTRNSYPLFLPPALALALDGEFGNSALCTHHLPSSAAALLVYLQCEWCV